MRSMSDCSSLIWDPKVIAKAGSGVVGKGVKCAGTCAASAVSARKWRKSRRPRMKEVMLL